MIIYPVIDVEKTFDQIVREYGSAVVLSEMLLQNDRHFLNADYIFHSEKIVVELKCLTEDNSKDENKRVKVERTMNHYFDTGKIKTKVINEDTWVNLPLKLQNSIIDIYATSIRDRIRKADDQIASTKERLGLSSYSGLLILANDGLKSLPPAAVNIAALRYIDGSRPNIDCMIYVTINILAQMEGVMQPLRLWLPTPMTEPPIIPDSFNQRLFNKFKGLVERQTGIKSHMADAPEGEEFLRKFWKAKNLE